MSKIKVAARLSASSDVQGWCYFAKAGDEMEVCEWANGEGFDLITSNSKGEGIRQQFTWGEWELLKSLVKAIQR